MKTVHRMIDVKYLRTFSQVAKHKSFTAAAESLFMTQPAVSQHIKKIENTIGASIFVRKEGFGLTKHGKVLLEYADQTMSMYEKLFKDLEKVDTREQYNIAIADSFCPILVEKVVSEFRALNNTDLAITSFSTTSTIDIANFDVIFSLNRLSSENGNSYQLRSSSYVISYTACIDLYECYPFRVVYCNSLSKTLVQELLKENKIDTRFVSSWVSTSSARLMNKELENHGTIMVCPDWSVREPNYKKIPTSQQVNMNVWFSEGMSDELDKIGLKAKLNDLFEQHH
ncbi:TPA: LysR family transcriptional regulator [Vibrio vulnificus]